MTAPQVRKDETPIKEDDPIEEEHVSSAEEDMNGDLSNDHVTDGSDDESDVQTESEESKDEDSYESEVESSSEDEREVRRKAQKHKKLKGMDPIYDSSGAESIRDRKNKKGSNHPTDQEYSDDEEPEKSVFSKIGNFLFFGCGGSNNKETGGKWKIQ